MAPKLEKPSSPTEFSSITDKLFDDTTEQLSPAASELPKFTAVTENLFMDLAPTFAPKSGPRQVIPVTEQLFMDEPIASNSDSQQAYAPLSFDTNIYPMKDTFGRLMEQELEKFSPFIGDECIALHKGGDDMDDKFDSMGFESFDDFEFPEEEFGFNASTEKLFQVIKRYCTMYI